MSTRADGRKPASGPSWRAQAARAPITHPTGGRARHKRARAARSASEHGEPYDDDARLGSITTDECIDCGACVPECPVEAIFDESQLPDDQKEWLKVNADKSPGLPVVNQKGDPLPGAEERKATLGF